jgi:hypothetical protein
MFTSSGTFGNCKACCEKQGISLGDSWQHLQYIVEKVFVLGLIMELHERKL